MDDQTSEPARGLGPTPSPRAELSSFLRTRRARLKPEDVGIADYGRYRRVPGLRREELAQLAGVSTAYYTRLEQGDGQNVSVEVLDSIARALRLSESERTHLTHLAKPRARRAPGRRQQVRAPVRTLLAAMDGVPAMIVGRRSDILAWNDLASAVFGDLELLPPAERNWARLVFLRPEFRDVFVHWEQKATDTVSQLRMDAGAHLDDPLLAALVGELSMKSDEFRQMWATYDVRERSHGLQRLRHPVVGELDLRLEAFRTDDTDQTLLTYHAEPQSPSAERLRLLASRGTSSTPEEITTS